MPLYNKEYEVLRAISSVFAQTVKDFELIVVNDGSTDGSLAIVYGWKDARIKVIDQLHEGVSAARNRAIAEAQADLIAFLDADDEWAPDFLETIFRLRSTFPSCDVFATQYTFCTSDGMKRPALVRGLPGCFREGILDDYFDIASFSEPPLWTSAVAVNKLALTTIGGFQVGITSGEDLLTWSRLALQYNIAYCGEPKAYFWGPFNVSDRPGRFPKIPDIVGKELAELMRKAPAESTPSVKKYLAFWHKMRAVIFFQLNDRPNFLKEVRTVAKYGRYDPKLFALCLLALLPHRIAYPLFKKGKQLLAWNARSANHKAGE